MPLFPAGERRVGISHIQIAVRAATTTAYGLETGSARDELPPLACEEEDLANCDQSTLTGCETNVTWHERHCGGCGQLCSGLCLGRICHEDTLIWEGNAYEVVSSTTTAFALVASQSGPYAVLQIDVLTAKASVLIDAADDDWQLAVSADRVYLLDPSAGVIRSARFDGTDLETEAAPQAVDSIGASLQGAYYVDTVELSDASSSSISRLWFRGTGEPSWTLLRESSSSEIIASSPYGVLVEDFEGEQRALLEVRGELIKAWTSEIESLPWQRAALTERGPVLSVPNQETGKGELYWLGDAVSHYALPHSNDELSFARLNVLAPRSSCTEKTTGRPPSSSTTGAARRSSRAAWPAVATSCTSIPSTSGSRSGTRRLRGASHAPPGSRSKPSDVAVSQPVSGATLPLRFDETSSAS